MTIEKNYLDFFKESPYEMFTFEGTLGLSMSLGKEALIVSSHGQNFVGLGKETLSTAKIILFDEEHKEIIIKFTQQNKTKMLKFNYQSMFAMGVIN